MTAPIDRRAFLRTCTAAAAGLSLPTIGCSKRAAAPKPATATAEKKRPPPLPPLRKLPPAVLGTLIGPGRRLDPARPGKLLYYLALLDLDLPASEGESRIRKIPMDFFGHGIAIVPGKPWMLTIFEKKGPGACEIDLRQGAVTRVIRTAKNRHFYGHGVFSADGSKLYCTEAIVGDASYKGVVAVRDGKTYEMRGTIDSFGHAPHDLHMAADGKTLVVTNGGGTLESGHQPSVAWIDAAGEKLQRKRLFDTPQVNAGHVALGKNGKAVVVSAPRDGMDRAAKTWVGGVSFTAGDKLHTSGHAIGKKLRGEVLSVAIDPSTGIAATTCPEGKTLAFWDVGTGALLAAKNLPDCRGVSLTLDGQWFAVTHDEKALVTLYGTRTLGAQGKAMPSWMAGSHVITHDVRAALQQAPV